MQIRQESTKLPKQIKKIYQTVVESKLIYCEEVCNVNKSSLNIKPVEM